MNEDKNKQTTGDAKGLEVTFPEEVKKGYFSNNVFITSTSEEFFLDFLSVAPPVGSVVSRIIVTPTHAKRLAKALKESIEKYEAQFGELPLETKKKAQ